MGGIVCPSCGHENIKGEDRCTECLHSLMNVDLPKPKKDDGYQQALMTTPVSELLTGKDLLVANRKDSVDKVIGVLQKEKLKCILVYEDKHIVGIVSNRDLLRKIAGKGKDTSSLSIGEIMTPNPEFVGPDEPIGLVVNKMALGGFRNLPVLAEDGAPLSIISINDVLVYLSHRDDETSS